MNCQAIASPPGSGGPQVLVVQPDPSCPLDRLETWLRDEGIEIKVIRPFHQDILPDVVEEDALIVLGGEMSSLDDHLYSWLAGIRGLFTDAESRRKPALGICLGAQLMSQAFGGTVARGEQGLEAGVVRVSWRPEVDDDALFGGLPDPLFVGSFHGDMIEVLPPSAVWLGSTAIYPHQAFRVGETSWGVQFHPELSSTGYRSWRSLVTGSDPLTVERADQGMADFEKHHDLVAAHTRMIAQRFARLINSAAAMPSA